MIFLRNHKSFNYFFLFACSYRRARDGLIKVFNTGQQNKIHKPTLSAETELLKTVWDQARLSSIVQLIPRKSLLILEHLEDTIKF